MRRITITMTVPDFVTEGDFYYWDKKDQRYMHVPLQDWVAPMDMRYVEGLEKRIDALETELREEVTRKFDVAHETFVKLDKRIEELEETFNKRIQKAHDRLNQFNERFANLNSHIDAVEGTFIERTDRLEKRIEAHAKSIASTDADIGEWCNDTDKLEKRIKKLETSGFNEEAFNRCIQNLNERMDGYHNRLAKLEKPCVDMETIVGAIGAPKLKPIPEPLVNRGPYTDILRRLSALEAHFNDSDREQKELAGDIKGLQGRINKICEETLVDA